MSHFSFDKATLAQHAAIIGKTGSGKTSTSKLAIEQVVAEGFRVCILDTIKSDWWGLTSSADGKKPGLPFKILGGPHGHVPLHSSAGKAIGSLVANGKLPLSIIDMADFEPGGIQKFFSDFAPALMRNAQGVLYLVIEEAHELAPKERSGIGNENMSIHWAKKLATAGRSKGIRLIVATQRIQSLHNAVLGSCDTLIAHRLTAPADQAPIKTWLKANTDKATTEKVERSLSSLPTGSGWLCSGEARIFEQVKFPKFRTYDNAATPEGDSDRREVKTAPVDQNELRAIIGDAVAEAEANDPKRLKARIAELERREPAPRAAPSTDPAALRAAEDRGRESGFAEGKRVGATEGYLQAKREAVAALQTLAPAEPSLVALPPRVVKPAPPAASIPVAATTSRAAVAIAVRPEPSGLSGPELKMLGALAWWASLGHPQPTRVMAAAICGWRVTSGHVKNVAGSLSSKGLIHYPSQGLLSLTDQGNAEAPPAPMGQLSDLVREILTGPQRAAYDVLLRKREMSREALCAAVGWNVNSGHPKNVLGSLSSLEIITYPKPGYVRLADWIE